MDNENQKRADIGVPLKRLVMWLRGKTEAQRAARNLEKCGCCCWCPACNDPLDDAAIWKPLDEYGHGNYLCGKCGHVSEWHFGIAPCPLLLPLPHDDRMIGRRETDELNCLHNQTETFLDIIEEARDEFNRIQSEGIINDDRETVTMSRDNWGRLIAILQKAGPR